MGPGGLVVTEVEVAVGPQEQVVDVLLGVRPQRPEELLLGEAPLVDEDLAKASPVLLLPEEGLEERFLRDETPAHEGLA